VEFFAPFVCKLLRTAVVAQLPFPDGNLVLLGRFLIKIEGTNNSYMDLPRVSL